jgi:sugar O-acyltransferase (sialic acid O-acetyltransferase NeuD family)
MIKQGVIFGYSGHAYVVLDMLETSQYNIIGYYDSEEKELNPFNLQYLGNEQDENTLKQFKDYDAFIGIGDNKTRSIVYKKLVNQNQCVPALIHKQSLVSLHTVIGFGSVVMAGAVINAIAKIGNAVIINSSSIIEHECIIADYAHIAPGAVLAGNVIVGEYAFVGANAVVKQGIKIGAGSVIGAGAVVTKNVPDGFLVYGNPAK